MYSITLYGHSFMRYVVIAFTLFTILKCVTVLFHQRVWSQTDDNLGRWTIRVWDMQFLLGLVLYFMSPISQFGLANFGEAMANQQLRQITLEHPILNLLAITILHVGWVLVRRLVSGSSKHTAWLSTIVVSMVLVFLAIPSGRPWLRFSIGGPEF